MSFFNSNITGAGGSGGAAGGLVTKFKKSVKLSERELAEITISLVEDIENYNAITDEQIIVEFDSISSDHVQNTILAELTHSYNAETGDLTITSTSSFVPFRNSNGESIDINIYVAGAVQIPPPPETAVYKVGTFTASVGSEYCGGTVKLASKFPNDFMNFTSANFIVECGGVTYGSKSGASGGGNSLVKNYDPDSGQLSVSFNGYSTNLYMRANKLTVYLVIGDITDIQ